MSDILGRMENLKRQSIKEFSLSQKTAHWLESPSSFILEELWNILKLEYLICAEPNFFLELVDGPIELLTCVGFEQSFQLWVTELPYWLLLFTVVYIFYRLVNFVVKSLGSNHLTTGFVDFISEARVIWGLNAIAFGEDSFSYLVEVSYFGREPRYTCTTNLNNVHHGHTYFIDCFLYVVLHERTFKVNVEVHSLSAVDFLWWLGLDLG